jgi:ArsR family transcriptional regulator
MTNISPVDQLSALLQTIGNPARLQILLSIGEGEVCVCHLEALMALREAGLVTDRRASRFIFYHLTDLRLLGVLHQVAELQSVALPELSPSPACECPNCSKQRDEYCK